MPDPPGWAWAWAPKIWVRWCGLRLLVVCSAADLVPLLSGSEDSSIAPQTGRIHSGQGLESEPGAEEKKRREQHVFWGPLLGEFAKGKQMEIRNPHPSGSLGNVPQAWTRIANFC